MAEDSVPRGITHQEGSPDPDAEARNAVQTVVGELFYYEHEDVFADHVPLEERRQVFQAQLPRYQDALQRGEVLVKEKLENEGVSFDVLPEERRGGRAPSYQGKQVYEISFDEVPIIVNPGEKDEYEAAAYTEDIHWRIEPQENDPFQRMSFRRNAARAGVETFEGSVSFWEDSALVALALKTGLAEQDKLYSKFETACRRVDRMREKYHNILPLLHSHRDTFSFIDSVRESMDDETNAGSRKVTFVSHLAESEDRLVRSIEEVDWYESELKSLRGLFLKPLSAHTRPADAEMSTHGTRPVQDNEIMEYERGLAVRIMHNFLRSDPEQAIEPNAIFDLDNDSIRDPRSTEEALFAIHDFVSELLMGDSSEAQAIRDYYGNGDNAIAYYVRIATGKVEENIKDLLAKINIDPELGMEYVESVVRQVLMRDFPVPLLEEVEHGSEEWNARVSELNTFNSLIPYRGVVKLKTPAEMRLYRNAEADLIHALLTGSKPQRSIPEEGYSPEETNRLISGVISRLEKGEKDSEKATIRLMNLLGIQWNSETMSFKINTGKTPLSKNFNLGSKQWLWLRETGELFMQRASEHFTQEEARNVDIEIGHIRDQIERSRLRGVFERVIFQSEFRQYADDRDVHKLTSRDYMQNLQRALKEYASSTDEVRRTEVSRDVDDIVDLHVIRTLYGITKSGSYAEYTFEEKMNNNEHAVVNLVRGAMIDVAQSLPAAFIVLSPYRPERTMKEAVQRKVRDLGDEYADIDGIIRRFEIMEREIMADVYDIFEGDPVLDAIHEFTAFREEGHEVDDEDFSVPIRRSTRSSLFFPEEKFDNRKLLYPQRSRLDRRKIEEEERSSIEVEIPLTREDLNIIDYVKGEYSLSMQEIFARGLRLKHDYFFLEGKDDLDEESEIVKDLDGACVVHPTSEETVRDVFTFKITPTDQVKLQQLVEGLREIGEEVDEEVVIREALRSMEFAVMHSQVDGSLVVPRKGGNHVRYHIFF